MPCGPRAQYCELWFETNKSRLLFRAPLWWNIHRNISGPCIIFRCFPSWATLQGNFEYNYVVSARRVRVHSNLSSCTYSISTIHCSLSIDYGQRDFDIQRRLSLVSAGYKFLSSVNVSSFSVCELYWLIKSTSSQTELSYGALVVIKVEEFWRYLWCMFGSLDLMSVQSDSLLAAVTVTVALRIQIAMPISPKLIVLLPRILTR